MRAGHRVRAGSPGALRKRGRGRREEKDAGAGGGDKAGQAGGVKEAGEAGEAREAGSAGGEESRLDLIAALGRPVPGRFLLAAEALRRGVARERIHHATGFDPWYLEQLERILAAEARLRRLGPPADAALWREIKHLGFTDARIAALTGTSEPELRAARRALDLAPSFRRIDTSAAEFPSKTPYLYSGWDEAPLPEADEASPSDRRKVIILGGGPNRIGQGIEFDHCCVHAVQALREAGCETIMINCNPETVSTDYSTADRLYFEPLTAEHVLAVAGREAEKGEVLGVLVQFGGQTPLGLARQLEAEGLPVLGTPVSAIDLAEDRDRFRALLDELGLKQPAARIARSREEAAAAAEELGYPVLLRPSYVLGGRAMRRVESREELEAWIGSAVAVSGDHPVLIDSYLAQATEADVDGLADGANAVVAGVMEHVEEAGIHSGDSACSLPADSLAPGVEDEIRRQGALLGSAPRRHRPLQHPVSPSIKGRSMSWRPTRAPRAPSPSSPRRPACPWPAMPPAWPSGPSLQTSACLKRSPSPSPRSRSRYFPFDRFPGGRRQAWA